MISLNSSSINKSGAIGSSLAAVVISLPEIRYIVLLAFLAFLVLTATQYFFVRNEKIAFQTTTGTSVEWLTKLY